MTPRPGCPAARPPSTARNPGRYSRPPLSVHVLVAGAQGTVCARDGEGGVRAMIEQLPGAALHEFPDAGHSIHNSADREAVLDIVKRAVDELAARDYDGSKGAFESTPF